MDDLAFVRRDLEALARFLSEHGDAPGSEWHLTHNLLLPTEAARDAVQRRLEPAGLFTSYVDTIDDELRPFWLDMMEVVPPDVAAIEAAVRRVLAALAGHDGEYNSFTLLGSRGEYFPAD